MYSNVKYLAAGDRAIIAEFGNKIEEEINSRIRSMVFAINDSRIQGIIELVPTYRSIMIVYDPVTVGFDELTEKLRSLEDRLNNMDLPRARITEIPTLYGGEYGPDLDFVARHNNISNEEVIRIHTSGKYLIYMIGFTPGFPYLGGMSEKISAPRLQTPRTKIPSGSVGIAGGQTGIYPIESPGGWQLIGRTPVKLYDPYREEPVLLRAGDYISFTSIDEKEYNEIAGLESRGEYKVKITNRDRR